MRASLPLLVAALALTGCSVSTRHYVKALDGAPVCCGSYASFPYETLFMSQERTVELGEDSPAFEFESGKSFFFAGRLPAYAGPLLITIDSYGPRGEDHEAAMLRPEVLLLDKAFQVRRKVPAEKFKRISGTDVSGTVFISEKSADEHYLVLYANTRPLKDGETLKRLSPTNLYLPGGVINIGGTEKSVPLSASPGGVVKLTLKHYAPASLPR